MTHFFISYAKADTRSLAFALEKALEVPPHITAWVDKELRVLDASWSRQIAREIKKCDYMILLLSPDVNRPDDHEKGESFVLREIRYARQEHKYIIPVMAQQTGLPIEMIGAQYVDFTGHSESDVDRLIEVICTEIGIQNPAQRREEMRQEEERRRVEVAERAQQEAEQRHAEAIERIRRPSSVELDLLSQSASLSRREHIFRRKLGIAILLVSIPLGTLLIIVSRIVNPFKVAVLPLPTAITSDIPTVTNNSDWIPQSSFFDNVEMVLVPPGCFIMGSDIRDFRFSDQNPSHDQCFDHPFYLDRFEVTNGQFNQLGGISEKNGFWSEAERPRIEITWFEASEFCDKRAARLPTEAEWEYAARGPDDLLYPWGNVFIMENVVFRDNASKPASVGSKLGDVSWVGAFDMSGNVAEWVSSIKKTYPYVATDGRESDDDFNSARVIRGGSWNVVDSKNLRTSTRSEGYPDGNGLTLGFRCARDY